MFYQSVCHFHLIIHSVSVFSVLVSLPNSLHQSVRHFHLIIHFVSIFSVLVSLPNSLHQSVCHFHLIIHSVSVISVLVSLPNDSYASSPEIDFCHSSLPVTLHPLFFKFKDCMFIWGLFLLQGLFKLGNSCVQKISIHICVWHDVSPLRCKVNGSNSSDTVKIVIFKKIYLAHEQSRIVF